MAIDVPWTLMFALLLVACAWTRTELYLGTSRPDGGVVTDEEWARFLDEEVTPRFPDGYTVVSAEGLWRGGHEGSHVIILLRKGHAEDVRAIGRAYRERFHQEAVLRVDAPVRVSFSD